IMSFSVVRYLCFFFFSSRRRHTRSKRDWSSDVCSSDLPTWTVPVCVPALCSFVMGLLLLLASPELSKLGSLEIPLSLGLAVLSYFGVWLLVPGGMRTLTEYFRYPLLSLRGRVGSNRLGARVHSDTSL